MAIELISIVIFTFALALLGWAPSSGGSRASAVARWES